MALEWLKTKIWPGSSRASRAFDRYVSSPPSLQNAIDAISGWKTSFPSQYRLNAGSIETYNDPRIRWAINTFGSLEGCRVLELEPLDGGHSSMLEAAGAQVDAVEPNRLAFLRCLITKEVLGLTRSTFWLGDVMGAMENWQQRYDLIVASRALGHLRDPLRFIALAAERTDAIYFWTRPITETSMPPLSPQPGAGPPDAQTHRLDGIDVRLYRNARRANERATTEDDERLWLNRDDLLKALSALGFSDIRQCGEQPNDPGWPALSILARR